MWTEVIMLAGTIAVVVATWKSSRRDPFGNDPVRHGLVPAFRNQYLVALTVSFGLSCLVLITMLMNWQLVQILLGGYLLVGSCVAFNAMRGWQNRQIGAAPQLRALGIVLGWPLCISIKQSTRRAR